MFLQLTSVVLLTEVLFTFIVSFPFWVVPILEAFFALKAIFILKANF